LATPPNIKINIKEQATKYHILLFIMLVDELKNLLQGSTAVIFAVGAFFFIAWIFRLTFNYAIPRMAENIDRENYSRANFSKLHYRTAMAFILLTWMIFGNMFLDRAWNIVSVIPFTSMAEKLIGTGTSAASRPINTTRNTVNSTTGTALL
jgi:nitrate reductase NapE component